MKKMFLLFSHKLTDAQIDDAKKSLQVQEFVYLPDQLQYLWSNIPPNITNLNKYLRPLEKFVLENANIHDYLLIQGDFGGVYNMVNFSKKNNLIPVHSTTTRNVQEKTVNGKVEKFSVFEHIIFREY
jgi:hypothetical protein